MYRLTQIVDSAKTGFVVLALAVVFGLFLGMQGCAPQYTDAGEPIIVDVRQRVLISCEAYASSLEKVLVWRDLGYFTDEQWAEVKRMDAATAPLCMTPEPSAEVLDLINAATGSLEALLITIIQQENS